MARVDRTENDLEALNRWRENPATPAARAELARYLAGKSSFVAARVAKIVAEFELHELQSQLVEAFHRFMKDPGVTDKGCTAKTEIVRALEALGAAEAQVFLAGVRHVQMEGSFGRPVDTAAPLRAASAIGLVRMVHPRAIFEIVALLVDPEDDARIGAVRALAYSGRPEAAPLLRLKVLSGDRSAALIAECFSALMALAPESSLEFVAGYLDSGDAAIVEAAAVALGQSRDPAGLSALRRRWEAGAGEPLRRALLTGLAVARKDSAFEFLYSVVETAIEKIAAEAVTALALYRHDERIRSRLESIVRARQGPLLARTLAAEFGQRP